jgi:hypothetical protein
MPRWRLAALYCLVATAVPAGAAARSPYIVDGMALGGSFQPGREHHCQPSEQFPSFTWCQRRRTEGRGTASTSIIYRAEGGLAYASRRVTPASFAANDIQNEIKRLTERFAEKPRVLRLPPRDGVANAVIALWGAIELELVEGAELAALAAGGPVQRGLLIDYLGDVNRSAELGLPVFRMIGEAGYLWSARHDKAGRGALRSLAIDASALAATSEPAPPQLSAVREAPVVVRPPPATVPTKEIAPPQHAAPDPEPVGTATRVASTAVADQPDRRPVELPAEPPTGPMPAAPFVAPAASSAPGVVAVLALLTIGLIVARRRWVARARREALYAALYPRAAMAPAIQADAPLKSYAAGAGLMALAILVYVGSQSPVAVRNMLGLVGWTGGAAAGGPQNR